jgi:hypothetical protein
VPKSSRVARQRALQVAAELRRQQARQAKIRWAWLSTVAAPLSIVLVLVLIRLVVGPPTPAGADTAGPTALAAPAAVTAVPAAMLDAIGKGTAGALPTRLTGQPALTSSGKPLVVYIGAEYCPFCAAQRWPLVVALSRFGTFANMSVSHSASDDVYPNTATLSFHGMEYTSPWLVFQGVETSTNVRSGNGYTPLDKLTPQQQQVLDKYNAAPYVPANSAGAIPFIDFGNAYLSSGASVSPQLMQGKSAEDIALALSNRNDPIAKGVLGSANAITAVLCQLTGDQPSTVCSGTAASAYRGDLRG